jgi:hypothetical protein
MKQSLYVERSNGRWEYWFYSDGNTYRYSTCEYGKIESFARRNDLRIIRLGV